MADILGKVKEIVADQLGHELDKLAAETHFVNDLNADSLDTVELVMELEEEFDITIPDEVAEKIETIGQAVEQIDGLLKEKD